MTDSLIAVLMILGSGLALALAVLWSDMTDPARPSPEASPENTVGRASFWGAALFVGLNALVILFAGDVLNASIARFAASVFCLLALIYFAYVIMFTLYLSARDKEFDADAIRLARNTAVSVFLTIATFAALYSQLGLNPPDCGQKVCPEPNARDFIYFSMVTFSTLGFGDFTPTPSARLYAGTQAILGNLHLGIFVGIALIAIKGRD